MQQQQQQQQSPYEFMKFIKAEGEKHLGIAVIRYEKRFIFRFKILPSEHGGYWATTASVKTGTTNGKDKYEPSFSLDSEYERTQMIDFVLDNVARELFIKPIEKPSVFTAPQQQYQQTQQRPINGNPYGQSTSIFSDDNIPF